MSKPMDSVSPPLSRTARRCQLSIGSQMPLPVPGQGAVSLQFPQPAPFKLSFRSKPTAGDSVLEWRIGTDCCSLWKKDPTTEPPLEECLGDWQVAGIGVDQDANCPYWFSLDSQNGRLLYGKGEVRYATRLCDWSVGDRARDLNLQALDHVMVSDCGQATVKTSVWVDPVVDEPPLLILPMDAITMDQMACGVATVPASLTRECQFLHGHVAGAGFQLDTPDFPEFSRAIEYSIATPGKWCYETLKKKAGEFGRDDPQRTYLRITMGHNQGESPGIPYVMEIWPPGHYSPVHNHGSADAVIKVLHGEILVHLFPMLSASHDRPFATSSFRRGQVTWLSPRINQVHQLMNPSRDTTCVTIQCYLYDASDRAHYEYFDYLDDNNNIQRFTPNSDMDYLAFNARMREEWGGGSWMAQPQLSQPGQPSSPTTASGKQP